MHLVDDAVPDDLTLDVVARFPHKGRDALFSTAARCLGAHDVQRSTVRLRQQEGAQGPSVAIELVGPGPEPDEHFLHDLVGEVAVAHEPQRE